MDGPGSIPDVEADGELEEFTSLSARSASLVVGLGLAMSVETVVLHLLLFPKAPVLSVLLSISSVAAVLWLADDYRIAARRPHLLTRDELVIRRGRMVRAPVRLSHIRRVQLAEWRDIPESASADYVNLSGPLGPNVMMFVDPPAEIRLVAGIVRRGSRVGLRLDEPARFVEATERRIAAQSASSSP